MKKTLTKINTILICFLSVCIFMCMGICISYADVPSEKYYVCFSTDNFKVRPKNEMELLPSGEYILTNVSLSPISEFYVTDNKGTLYKGADGKNLKVNKSGEYDYNIKFNPNDIYSSKGDYEDTFCRVTYGFYTPKEYSIKVNQVLTPLKYNNFNTDYDLYYLSSVYLQEGQTIEYESQIFTSQINAYYRVLFTPGENKGGNDYLFNDKGVYGTGEEYKYHMYITDTPNYYLTFRSPVKTNAQTIQINGYDSICLERNEDNISSSEYKSEEIFISEKETAFKYQIYETNIDGEYNLIDDDDNVDTQISTLLIDDIGWYSFRFIDNGDSYKVGTNIEGKKFIDYYLAGDMNGYCYDSEGNVNLLPQYKFVQIEESSEDYDKDYIQYELTLKVTENMLKQGDVEVYITNGEKRYLDGDKNIKLSRQGTYRFLFSDEHIYGRKRNYRYTLEKENKDKQEIYIHNTQEFIEFAKNCSLSADYSVNKEVYLTVDLDFSGVDFVSIKDFSGVFNGGYHKLKNITLNGDNDNIGIFSMVTKEAVIQRLLIENINIDCKDSNYVGVVCKNFGTIQELSVTGNIIAHGYVGGVCGYNGRSSIDSSSPDSSQNYRLGVITKCENNAIIKGDMHIGGICGYNMGDINTSTNNGKVIGYTKNTDGTAVNVGGICGYSVGKIYNCTNNGNIENENTSLYVGGICGICTGEIYLSDNKGNVKGNRYTGGGVGYYGKISKNENDLNNYFGGIDYTSFIKKYFGEGSLEFDEIESDTNILSYIVNTGNIQAVSYVGGIIGYSEKQNLEIKNCLSDADIKLSAGNYAGGIGGYIKQSKIIGCMTMGSVSAKGLNAGEYVGGICGYGQDIIASASSCFISGDDYLGGISGYQIGEIQSCYSNVLIQGKTDTKHKGGITGFSQSYSVSENNFGEKLKYNYYIGIDGGIDGKEYGSEFDYASKNLTTNELISNGMLSPFLDMSFSSEYWQGGEGDFYPQCKNFDIVKVEETFKDDKLFTNIFENKKIKYIEIVDSISTPTYLITFMEWNDEKGDLYDDDNIINLDNFECIANQRIYKGQAITPPKFQFASPYEDRFIIQGSKNNYFAKFVLDEQINQNTIIYAHYEVVVNSINTLDNKIFVEGIFQQGTTIESVVVGNYVTLNFYLNGEKINVKDVTVKYYIGENVDDYVVQKMYKDNVKPISTVDSDVKGKYIAFNYSSGEYFTLTRKILASMPSWAWALVGGGIAVLGVIVVLVIVFLVKKHNIKKKQG